MVIRSLAKLALLVAIVAGMGLFANPAAAQRARQIPRYSPQTPTTSPFLSLFNRSGSVSNYYTFVRPEQNRRSIDQQQTRQLQSQSFRIDQVQSNLPPEMRQTGQAGWFQTHRGPNSRFQNRTHYYQTWDSRSIRGG